MNKDRIIAIFNQSGGVAKTTMTQNIGYHLALKGKKVLLIDADSQASLSVFCGIETDDYSETIQQSVVDNKPLPIHPELIHGMELISADINLAACEIQLSGVMAREQRLKKALAPIQDQYDFILIDCPPSLGILSVLSLTAATHVLVPIQCQFKSFKGTELLLETIANVQANTNPNLQFAGFIPTMVDTRTTQESRTLEALQTQLAEVGTVHPPIPRSIAFADASENRLPLALWDKRHPAVAVLQKIAGSLIDLKD